MALDARSLQRLRQRLPARYIQPTLDKLGRRGKRLSKSYVSQILSGDRFDQEIVEALISVADEHQSGVAELKARARGMQRRA